MTAFMFCTADEEFVYLHDQKRNCYVFSAGECVDYIKYDDYYAYLAKTDTFVSAEGQKETNGYRFYVKWASVFKGNPNGTAGEVVHRPVFFGYFQGITPFVVIMFWMAVFTSMIITKKRDY